ncbi:hypothetical protein ABW21_db0204728 [Orbilia brochopaga]|nr:hypothetical protein ABW21_db0204728 [Drechslerella brochopaga]
MASKKLRHENYTIAWICALPIEMAAAKAILDETHVSLPQHARDGNTYTLGEIGGHNVAVACLPSGVYGITSAGIVASQMLFTYTAIRFGLMVGIGGGAPTETADIRLGDVVVSKPTGTLGGVVQFDIGKTLSNGRFERTGALNKPPQVVLTALSSLQADYLIGASRVPAILSDMVNKYPAMGLTFSHPSQQQDALFEAAYEHVRAGSNCDHCDKNQLIERNKRTQGDPVIHYGLIASSNQVMRDGVVRDRLAQELNVLCFEMEAAGLMDNFPCVVVRGIADYADSHKNKNWQEYAAAAAAAYAKCLISATSTVQTSETQTVIQATSNPGARMAARSIMSPKVPVKRGPDVQKQSAPIERQLTSYFSPIRDKYFDEDFDIIAMLLGGSTQTRPYAKTPRLYTLLRHLEIQEDARLSSATSTTKICPKYLDAFLKNGLSDRSFPFSQSHLPADPSEGWKIRFLEAEHIVCDSSNLFRMMCLGKHMTFTDSSPDEYFLPKRRIAPGERSEVDEVLCVLGKTGVYARKRFFKRVMVGDNASIAASFEIEIESLNWAHTNRSTTTKAPPRTWKYASPEVARLGLQEDIRINSSSDVWSLGCIFLEIITVWVGRPLSELEKNLGPGNYYQKLEKIQLWINRLREQASDLANEALDWVERMLQEPSNRRPSAHKLVEESKAKQHPWEFCCAECLDLDHKRIEPKTTAKAIKGSTSPVETGTRNPQYQSTIPEPVPPESLACEPESTPPLDNTWVDLGRSFSWRKYLDDVCTEMDLASESLRESHLSAIRASYAVYRKAMLAAGFTEI